MLELLLPWCYNVQLAEGLEVSKKVSHPGSFITEDHMKNANQAWHTGTFSELHHLIL